MKRLTVNLYSKILFKLLKNNENKKDEVIKEFIDLLKINGATSRIDKILKGFKEIVDKENVIHNLEIETPFELDEKAVDKIISNYKIRPNFKLNIDKKLLGGVIIKEDNFLLDASLKTKLNNLKKTIN